MPEIGGPSTDADVPSDASTDELGVIHDESLAAFHDCSSFILESPAVDLVSSGPESCRSSFSYYSTATSTLIDTSESDSEKGPPSRCTSVSSSILPPDVEERRMMPSWPSSPAVPLDSSTAITDRLKSRKQWLLELHSKRDLLSQLLQSSHSSRIFGIFYKESNPTSRNGKIFGRPGINAGNRFGITKKLRFQDSVDTENTLRRNPVFIEAFSSLQEADTLILNSQRNKGLPSGTILFGIFRANGFKAVLSRLDNAIRNLSWLFHSFGILVGAIDRNGNGESLPPLALYDNNSFLIWWQLAKIYCASWNDKSREVNTLVSSTCNNKIYVKNRRLWLEAVFGPLMDILRQDGDELLTGEKRELDKSIRLALQEGFAALYEYLKITHVPFQVHQATIAYAISELTANDPHFLYEYAKEVSVIIISHFISLYESRTQVNQQESDDISCDKKPFKSETLIYANAMATRALWNLAKGSPSITKTIIGSSLLFICLTRLTFLEDEPPESRLVSVKLLMEVANLGEKDDSLRHFFSAVYMKDSKDICHQLRSISKNGGHNDDYSDMVLCIMAFTCLAKAFEMKELSDTVHFYEGWEIMGTLLHILETMYSGIVTRKIGVMLSKDIPLRSLIHDPEIRASELVLLCCITKYVVPAEFDDRVDIRALLEWASEERYLTRDATIHRLILEAKSNLDLGMAFAPAIPTSSPIRTISPAVDWYIHVHV